MKTFIHGLKVVLKQVTKIQCRDKSNVLIALSVTRLINYFMLQDKVCYLTFVKFPSRFVQTTGTTFCVKEATK